MTTPVYMSNAQLNNYTLGISAANIYGLQGTLPPNVTLQGNIINTANGLVKINSTGKIDPFLLPDTVTTLGNTTNAPNSLLLLDASGKVQSTLLESSVTKLGNSTNTSGGIVVLDLNGKLPVNSFPSTTTFLGNSTNTSGGLLVLDAGGRVATAQLPSTTTFLGNVVNAADGLIKLDASGRTDAARLPVNTTIQGNIVNEANGLVKLSATAKIDPAFLPDPIGGFGCQTAAWSCGVVPLPENVFTPIPLATRVFNNSPDTFELFSPGTPATMVHFKQRGAYMVNVELYLDGRNTDQIDIQVDTVINNTELGFRSFDLGLAKKIDPKCVLVSFFITLTEETYVRISLRPDIDTSLVAPQFVSYGALISVIKLGEDGV